MVCTDRHEIIVTYLPQGVSLNHPDRYNLTIETYSNTLESEQAARSNINSDRDDFIVSNGDLGTINDVGPERVKFTIPNSEEVVEVQYPSIMRKYDVHVDAERLKLISELKP